MKTIYEHNAEKAKVYNSITPWKLSGIECPECKNELYKNTMIAEMAYPPKMSVKCRSCGYKNKVLM